LRGPLVYSKDDKLVKIEGDPECPFNQGRACAKTLSMRRFIDHPQRLKYPLKRVGERGEDKWERISWDEAIGHDFRGAERKRAVLSKI